MLAVLAVLLFGVSAASAATTYTLSVEVTGLTSGTLVVQDNKNITLSFTSDTTQTFSNTYAPGAVYQVKVKTQPAGQTCTLSSTSGTMTANTTVTATCVPVQYTISVSATGLASGASLVVEDAATDQLTFTSNDTQTFATTYTSGSTYKVSIVTQPAGQTCTLGGNASGTITANVTVKATCKNNYSISVAVTGLTGTLVVQDSKSKTLTFKTNTTQTFSNVYTSGSSYTVTVKTQPTGETCTLSSNATGTITANTTVTATCAPTTTNYTLSVAVTGLTGTLGVEDNVGDQLTFTTNNTQTFATSYASGSTYSVTITSQPSGQTCTLGSNASGTISANTTVTATCTTNTYTLSAAVSGLSGTLVLKDNIGNSLTFTSNSTQTFSNTYTSGSTYSVTVQTQPSGQTCTLGSNASGTITANTTVTATCISNYTIGVAVTGLASGASLVVEDSPTDQLTFTTNNTQTFATTYTSGSTYTVSIVTQPSGQTCTLGSNASGTITSNITVSATCTNNAQYTISVAVTGLTSGTLVVQDNPTDQLTFTTNNTQTFTTKYASGASYAVTVVTQPSGQTCTLSSNASGTITSNITVTATCAAATYTVSVAVTGLTGTLVLQDDQSQTLTFTSNTTQAFSNTYANGAAYTVYVTSQPATLACIPTFSTGTISSGNVTISATCATGATRALGTVSGVSTISCEGSIRNGVCQQMTISCPGLPDVQGYVKTNSPTGTTLGYVTYTTGTDGNGLYDSVFTYGSTAVQNVINAGYTTVQISWGTPFNTNEPDGWVLGPGGVLSTACRYATIHQWIYNNIQNNTSLPLCATGNSGGAGALAYALSQYPTPSILSMAEVTSGPPAGRLDWGCGCTEGTMAVQCGTSSTLGTCFGKADAPVWDPAYNPNQTTGVCTTAVDGTLPPGGLNFFLGDSVEAPGAIYSFPNTYVNLVFGSADSSSAIPIGQHWFDNITTNKGQVCVTGGEHSMADTLAGAEQIANDLIANCKIQ
jgi:hypothetical protein